jgi:tRNA 2-selenouridine synthase SelU
VIVLALQWRRFSACAPVFIEEVSHAVGKCGVPPGLWQRMRSAQSAVLRLQVPHEARVAKLVSEYGVFPPQELAACVRGLYKRLGHAKVDELVALLLENEPPELAQVRW